MKIKYYLVRDRDTPVEAVVVGQWDNGFYFLPELVDLVDEKENIFHSIEEIGFAIGRDLYLDKLIKEADVA